MMALTFLGCLGGYDGAAGFGDVHVTGGLGAVGGRCHLVGALIASGGFRSYLVNVGFHLVI